MHANETILTPSDSVKDLGVLIDDKLKFHGHSSLVASKANRILAIMHIATWLFKLVVIMHCIPSYPADISPRW